MFYKSIIHSTQFKYLGALYLHSIIRMFSVSIFSLFSSIYIFQVLEDYGFSSTRSLALTALFFGLLFLIHTVLIAPSLWLMAKKGLRFSVFWANIFLIGFFIFLFFAKNEPVLFLLAALCGGLEVALYWTAYHIYFVELSDDKKQGEEISIVKVLSSIVAIGGPAFGGLIITYGGFGAVFLVMMILVLLAIAPLKYLPKSDNIVKINILETVRALNPRKEFKSYVALIGIAISEISYTVFWPIYVFPMLSGFSEIGLMGSLMALVASVFAICLGFLIDKIGAKNVLNYSTVIDSFAWTLKIFVQTPLHIFGVAGLSSVSASGQNIALDSLVYEKARHTNVAACIVQKEIALSFGRAIFLFFAGILFWFGVMMPVIFILIALITLLSIFYPKNTKL